MSRKNLIILENMIKIKKISLNIGKDSKCVNEQIIRPIGLNNGRRVSFFYTYNTGYDIINYQRDLDFCLQP